MSGFGIKFVLITANEDIPLVGERTCLGLKFGQELNIGDGGIAMKCMKTILAFAMICSLMALGGTALAVDGATAEPWFVEGMNQEEMILEPGTTAFCNKDIVVQNLSDKEAAHVRIARGNGDNYDWDQINPKETLAYERQGSSIFSGAAGAVQHVEDVRIVNGTMGTAKLKVLCK